MVSPFQLIREQRRELPIVPNENKCAGHTYVIVGANTGLGFECAQHLVRLKAKKVILACRSISRGEAAKAMIEENTGRNAVMEVWQVNLGSYESVQAFANRFSKLERIDAVIENAGIAMLEHQEMEGLESTLTVNVVGIFLLAALSLPHLERSAEAHGINPHLTVVGSEVGFGMKGELEKIKGDVLDGLSERAKSSMSNRYQVSKLLEAYTVREFARRLSERGSAVTMNYVNPGMCKTELSRNVGPLLRIVFVIVQFFLARTAEMGSRTLLHAAFAGPESHGKYVSACEIQEPAVPDWVKDAHGQDMQKRVWSSLTKKLEFISPGCLEHCLSPTS